MTGYVRAALDAGARIFKVHLQVGGFAPDDPQLDEVWGLLTEARVPVVVHAGHARSVPGTRDQARSGN